MPGMTETMKAHSIEDAHTVLSGDCFVSHPCGAHPPTCCKLHHNRALESGACKKADTQVELLHDNILHTDFILRVSAIVRDKPIHITTQSNGTTDVPQPQLVSPPNNPFLPYDPAMWVCHITNTHTLLLNKFNLVDHHVLVITQDYAPQEQLLCLEDFTATCAVLHAMQPAGLAFFNCGPLSGASQPHKHVQLLPLPLAPEQSPRNAPATTPLDDFIMHALGCDNGQADDGGATASNKAGPAVALRTMPFQAYACAIPQDRCGALVCVSGCFAWHMLVLAQPAPCHTHTHSNNTL